MTPESLDQRNRYAVHAAPPTSMNVYRFEPSKASAFQRDNLLMGSHHCGARLIIVCGLPGSGKTSHARQLQSSFSGIRFSPDEWMDALSIDVWDEGKRGKIEALQWEFAQQLLARGLTVIIEWGTWGRSERDALRLRARELGAAVELHYLLATVDVLLERIHRRGMEYPPITKEQLLKWMDIFQAPTPEEIALFDAAITLEG